MASELEVGKVSVTAKDTSAILSLYRDDATIGNNNVLGDINFGGADAPNESGAIIRGISEAAWTSGSAPTGISFMTTPTSSVLASERLRIDRNGLATFSNGINLGDTTLANYEQGNFTLTDASGAGLTITGGLGRYTRIGNTVHVTIQFTMPTTSNSSAMKLSGLPYAVPNDNDYRGLVLNYSNKTGVEYALTQKNSDVIDFYTDAGANATNADGSGGGFYINGHYKV